MIKNYINFDDYISVASVAVFWQHFSYFLNNLVGGVDQ